MTMEFNKLTLEVIDGYIDKKAVKGIRAVVSVLG
jgi:hypothetical protein